MLSGTPGLTVSCCPVLAEGAKVLAGPVSGEGPLSVRVRLQPNGHMAGHRCLTLGLGALREDRGTCLCGSAKPLDSPLSSDLARQTRHLSGRTGGVRGLTPAHGRFPSGHTISPSNSQKE